MSIRGPEQALHGIISEALCIEAALQEIEGAEQMPISYRNSAICFRVPLCERGIEHPEYKIRSKSIQNTTRTGATELEDPRFHGSTERLTEGQKGRKL